MYEVPEFINYKATPNEKHIGIATIKLYGKILLRYRVFEGREGKGMFISSASYKITEDGIDGYVPAFMIDSRNEENTVRSIIIDKVKRIQKGEPIQEECPF